MKHPKPLHRNGYSDRILIHNYYNYNSCEYTLNLPTDTVTPSRLHDRPCHVIPSHDRRHGYRRAVCR